MQRVNQIKRCALIVHLLAVSVTGTLWAQETAKEAGARGGEWHTDFDAAKQLAKKEGKDLLMEFTRSEGCGWCLKLEKEVLSQTAFKEEMTKNYVLVMLDYPRDSSQLSPEVKEQQKELQKYYHIRRFPSFVFADASGRPYARESYRDRKAEEYLKEITGLHKQRERRDAAFAQAENAEGKEKARLLEKGLSEVSRRYHLYYPKRIAEIAKADPEDTSGYVAKVRVDEVRVDLGRVLRTHYEERKYEAIPLAVDGYISEHKPKGNALQVALLYKVQAFYLTKQHEEAKALADEVIALNNVSRAASYASSIKKRIERMSEEGK